MFDIGLPIIGNLLWLAIVIGIIVLVARAVGRRSGTPSEGAGVAVRRFLQYSIMLITLVLAGTGLAGLVDAAWSAAAQVEQDTAAVARSIAFVVVALPVFGGLALFTKRHLDSDPAEARSLGWAAYLTIALIGSLVAVMPLAMVFFGSWLADGEADRTLVAPLVIWCGVWLGHWWTAQRRISPERMRFHFILGSAAGIVAVAVGAGMALGAALAEFYDGLVSVTVVDDGVDAIVRGAIVLAVGAPVWWWYWYRHTLPGTRTPLWYGYVLLFGVLGGLTALLIGAGVAVFGVLQWFVGEPGAVRAAAHFDFIPGAAAAMAVGAGSWMYHRSVLGRRGAGARTEVDRVYDYILSGAGLVVAAGGLATLITVALDAVGGAEIASSDRGDAVAAAITLLVLGAPLWWYSWSIVRGARRADPEAEVRSPTRRIYLFALFGASGLAAIIGLIVAVFLVVEDLLDGTAGAATVSSVAVPLSLVLTAGAVAWYHFAVFREDRTVAVGPERPHVREVIVVGDASLATLIASGTTARVQRLGAVDHPSDAATADAVVAALESETHARVVVVATNGHFEVLPLAG